jgi:serine/threonine-protein kinase HipA
MSRCLSCYQPLAAGEIDFHAACARKLFGQSVPPELPYTEDDLEPLAREAIQSQVSVPGVQAKLSLQITGSNREGKAKRFTIVGLWGGYILKPPSAHYPQLPEVEDLTMHLAAAARMNIVPHSLIRLASGSLAYITSRVDRTRRGKLAMEDMCQLTGRLTEDKYQGSYEQIAMAIQLYSATPGLDLVNFFELLLFSYLTGNADMHLKNFSLLEQPGMGMILSPAYDLLNTQLVNPLDREELALTLNGKKRKINKQDFVAAMSNAKMDEKQQANIFDKMLRALPKWQDLIDISFLSEGFKDQYRNSLQDRIIRLG